MRVAIVHSFYRSSQPSGENVVVNDQIRSLIRSGHDVHLFRRDTDDLIHGRRYRLDATINTVFGKGASPAKALTALRPDVVHVHNTFPNWSTQWLSVWGKRTVATLHNYRSVCAAGTLFRDGHSCIECLERPVFPAIQHSCYGGSRAATLPLALASGPRGSIRRVGRDASTVIALNEEARMLFSRVFEREIECVPNFVTAVDQTGKANNRWVFIGRLSFEKGIVPLLHAWPPGEKLDVVGGGPLEDEIRRLSQQRSDVTYRGILRRGDLLGLLGGYEGLIVPSLWSEGLPTVLLEALSQGVPCLISNRVASSSELARRGAAAIYDPSAGPAALAAGLSELRRTRSAMSASARDLWETEYSEQIWLERIERIYHRVKIKADDRERFS